MAMAGVINKPATAVQPMRRRTEVSRSFFVGAMGFVIAFISGLGEAWTLIARAVKVLSAP
ncbi:MAG: hypothetical protein B7Z12_11300 [Caulobacter vibrioides]|uniref:Uncharacterized protein n=1 Tax=Caulobacter vibrioides TaxID=155892 RepID=A0A258D515_CAUVI|nr:MAG: hypothetical protein B7Z12_11300 [Caulobacter vibrioides]